MERELVGDEVLMEFLGDLKVKNIVFILGERLFGR